MLATSTDKDKLFTKIWTLKEAILKSAGIGFAKGINAINIGLINDTEIIFNTDLGCFESLKLKEYAIFQLDEYIICIVSS